MSIPLHSPENHDVMVAHGKMQYEIIKMDSAMPQYGPCWRNALALLDRGCKHLDDDMQSRLALAFTNCFLAKVSKTQSRIYLLFFTFLFY